MYDEYFYYINKLYSNKLWYTIFYFKKICKITSNEKLIINSK